jgi:hypothetical protein
MYRLAARLVARPREVRGTGSPTFHFSGRTYRKLARIVRALRAVAGRCCLPLGAAVAVTVAVIRAMRPRLATFPARPRSLLVVCFTACLDRGPRGWPGPHLVQRPGTTLGGHDHEPARAFRERDP